VSTSENHFWLKRARSFVFAFRGLKRLVQTQHNAWLHLTASLSYVAFGGYLGITQTEWCWLLAGVGSVWVAEAFNTSLEFIADATCPNYHPSIRDAKDIAAAGVLLVAVIATLNIWIMFFPHVAAWF
jgi:diacylglycerol kinase (ATP)